MKNMIYGPQQRSVVINITIHCMQYDCPTRHEDDTIIRNVTKYMSFNRWIAENHAMCPNSMVVDLLMTQIWVNN